MSLPKDENPLTVTLETAVRLIEEKRKQEEQRHIKSFEEDDSLELRNGKYGPYISYNGNNYRIPKELHPKAAELTYEKCMEIVNTTPEKKKPATRRRK